MRIALVVSLLALALLPAAASAAPDRSGAVSPTAATFAWDGPLATGYNTERDVAACSHDTQTYCDQTLIKVDVPEGAVGILTARTGEYFGPQCTPLDGQNAPCDFSLWLYTSDATGKAIKNIGSSVNDSGEDEEVSYKKATSGYYLVVVFYYTVAQASYKGTATLSGVTLPPAPVAAPPVTAPDATGPTARLTAKLAAAGRAKARTGIPLRLTCSVACRGTLTAELSAAQARRLGLGKRKVVVGRGTVSLPAAGSGRVALKLTPRAALKLARARKVKLTLRASLADAAGVQHVTATRTVTLKR